ncbi:hemagglutinin [Mycoplasmopsis synoviae]|uniref:hemagglutinin n=1 Tax=Mycoplasmopsis synoviae TaxID=2109 RepID=UPI0034DB3D7F
MGEDSAAEGAQEEDAQAPQAPTTPDLASTVSYLKSLNDTLKAATDALNGDNPTTKTAYYKADAGRTLYWDGFMPKITLESFTASQTNVEDNKSKLQTWFNTKANWSNLEDQLVKKLGSEKFKNVKLTNPQVDWDIVNSNQYRPKVTFDVTQKEGYELQSGSEFSQSLTMVIRVLYTTQSPNANVLQMQGASSSAAPAGSTPSNNAAVIRDVNVYMNYTGPNIELDADLPQVGNQNNTSINGTSNVDGDFNTKFKNLLINVVGGNFTETSLFQAIINYVNKFDPKFRAAFVTEKNGVALTSVQNGTQLRIGNLNDFLYNNKGFLQQVNGDSSAAYFTVNGVTSEGWLNTFLIRIPLTKFVKPLSVFTAPVVTLPAEEATEGSQTQTSTPQTMPNSSQ